MIRYSVAALAAIYSLLLIFGDEARRPEVTRQAQDDVTGISLASFSQPESKSIAATVSFGMSDADAVQVALAAGKELRAGRKAAPMRGMIAAVEAKAAPATQDASVEAQSPGLWYVTGNRVNLRAGPGTGNAVVGQLVLGDKAEVMDDQNGWYQIRTADGVVSGWIFGKFLSDSRPG